jgi:hypothetical protein
MKSLFLALALNTPACPNFAGLYTAEDGTWLTVEQTSCEAMRAIYSFASGSILERPMIFDGERRTYFETDGLMLVEASHLEGDAIVTEGTDYYYGQSESSRSRIFLEGNTFVEEVEFLDGFGQPYRSNRLEFVKP